MAEINQAIGATGVVSGECKMVVQQYGDQIIELLLQEVGVPSLLNIWFGATL